MQKTLPLLFALLTALFLPPSLFAQDNLWRAVNEKKIPATNSQSQTAPRFYRMMALNTSAMQTLVARAPMEFTAQARAGGLEITLPKPGGGLERFRLEESPTISSDVAAERPDWKTYSGRGIDDPTAVMRMSWSNEGLRAYVLGTSGAYYVDPYSGADRENYITYLKSDLGAEGNSFHCEIESYFVQSGRASATHSALVVPTPNFTNGGNLRTYRVAVATTGEYTVDRGGQASALTDVMNAINRINLIYRRDLAVALTLVSGTNTIFPDPNTDPYNNTDDPAQLAINQTQLDNIIGNANYDLGHLFGTGGGGIASSPSVCSTQKAEGYSARMPPTGDPFWVDYVSHEMGHQLAASHTYNTLETGACSTRSAMDAYEPASGDTIMSYVGICGDRNLQKNSIDNFHIRSLTQIFGELANTQSGGGSCGTVTATGNNAPVANAGADFTIPKLTPFTLTATATDADADTLTYSWEEYDLAPSASGPNGTPAGTYDVDNDGVLRPLFRTYSPSTSPSRTFPSLPYVLNNANTPPVTYTGTAPTGVVCENGVTCTTGETLPAVARTMNFRVAVRDGRGGISDAGMQVNVRNESGPFVVTAPNTAVSATGGSTMNVTWNVANTNVAPISATNVKISLSTDGGQTFPTILSTSTANNGSANVTLPNVSTTNARIKVEAVGNIFFDISDANFTITANGAAPTSRLLNISTRLAVQTGDNVLIGGFIVSGTQDKKVIVRGLGPSLPVAGKLADPTLDLFAGQTALESNDNWMDSPNRQAIIDSTVAPTNNAEAAIIRTLPANNSAYTAIVRGANNSTGVGLVEIYDLDGSVDSKLANISTRGLVQTGDNVLIGGLILGTNPLKVIVRGIGPSLAVPGKLADPTLDLVDQNGTTIRSNDNWRTDQEAEITSSGVPPTNDLEAAIVATLPAAPVTAIVRGKDGSTGVGLVEVYALP